MFSKSLVVATGVFPAKSVMVKLKAYQLVGTPFKDSEFCGLVGKL